MLRPRQLSYESVRLRPIIGFLGASLIMKKKLFLHAGMAKTGTTSIQSGLLTNRKELAKLGFYYPTDILRHHQVSRHFKGVRRFDHEISEFVKDVESTDCHSVVISSEMFERMPPAGWQEFKDVFNAFDIHVVIYLRRQADVMVSMYSELVKKHALSSTFDTFIKSDLRLNLLDYKDVIERLVTAFGAGNITARLFSKEALIEQDPFLDFLHTIGAQALEPEKTKHANASYSSATTKVVQVANKHGKLDVDHLKNYGLACRLANRTNKLIETNYSDVERIKNVQHGFKDMDSLNAFQEQFLETNAWVEKHFLEGQSLSSGSKDSVARKLAKDDLIDIYDDLIKDITDVYIKRYGEVKGRAKAVGRLWQLILDEDVVE